MNCVKLWVVRNSFQMTGLQHKQCLERQVVKYLVYHLDKEKMMRKTSGGMVKCRKSSYAYSMSDTSATIVSLYTIVYTIVSL